jgi:hypothetical protein
MNGNVDVDGRMIWTLFLATLLGFFGLTASRMSLELLAERLRSDPTQGTCELRLPPEKEHSVRPPSRQVSTPQEFAESESDDDDDDEGRHLLMSFSERLPSLSLKPARGIGWPSGRSARLVPPPLSLLSQRLIC